jgi:hypothetical protein
MKLARYDMDVKAWLGIMHSFHPILITTKAVQSYIHNEVPAHHAQLRKPFLLQFNPPLTGTPKDLFSLTKLPLNLLITDFSIFGQFS